MSEPLLDRAGRRRSPATLPGFHTGRPPRNKGLRYPADPPTVEEIIAVMRAAGDGPHGQRLRGLIAILWRAGLRIQEALSLGEADLDQRRGSLLVRHGKADDAAKSAWTRGAGSNCSPGLTHGSSSPSDRCCASSRGYARPALGERRRARTLASDCRPSRRAATLRPAPAATRPRRRDGPRRRPARGHSTPARPQQPRHHLRLPPGHRQRRDHRHRPRPPDPDGPGQRTAAHLTPRREDRRTAVLAQSASGVRASPRPD